MLINLKKSFKPYNFTKKLKETKSEEHKISFQVNPSLFDKIEVLLSLITMNKIICEIDSSFISVLSFFFRNFLKVKLLMFLQMFKLMAYLLYLCMENG